MFGFGKDKLKDFQTKFMDRIYDGGLQVSAAITAQVQFSADHFDINPADAWQTVYTRYYIFGAYDSLTCDFPIEMRQKVGRSIIELGFIDFVKRVFELSEDAARASLDAIFVFQAKHPTFPPIIEGGVDGMEMRKGRPALRLLAHLFDEYKNPEL